MTGMPTPEILVVAPPAIQKPKGNIAAKFQAAASKSIGLAAAYEEVAHEYFGAGRVTASSAVDGVHLDENQHRSLGVALADVVEKMFERADA